MIEQVLPNIYKMEIILPNNALRALNSYLIKGEERNLIIDTGMNREECMDATMEALAELEVDLNITDFFITHMHSDHSGLIAALKTDNSKVYCSKLDSYWLNKTTRDQLREGMNNFYWSNGFPENELNEAMKMHPVKFSNIDEVNYDIVAEGSTISVGGYTFTCLETPGHTKGHMCLYEPQHKILISGDHILSDITPNITLMQHTENPLGEYMQSLEKVSKLKVDIVLPGHRRIFQDHQGRIKEIVKHHEDRNNEVLEILEKGPMDAYQVASKMTWNIREATWDEFAAQHKFFAAGEVAAHLRYLEMAKEIKKKLRGQRVVFQLYKSKLATVEVF